MSSSDPVLIAGLGNPLLGDEGVGCRVVELLSSQGPPPGVEVRDFGTSGMALLHALAGRSRVVIVDCADFGGAPGEARLFTPGEVRSRKVLPRLSLHEGDLLQILDLARSLGEAPREIVILGIQPARIEPGPLSPAHEQNLPHYARLTLSQALHPVP